MIKWKNNEAREAYHALVEHCISSPYEGYTERHHIVPRSMGGSDDQDNLVRMSAQNHLLAHYWLWVGTGAQGMATAYWGMLNMNYAKMAETFAPTQAMLEAYESARIASAKAQSERVAGKTLSADHRAKMSASLTGEKNPMFGKTVSAKTRAKMRAAKFGKTGSLSPRAKKVLMKLDCGLTLSYGSAREAARCLEIRQTTIAKRCRKGIKGFSYA